MRTKKLFLMTAMLLMSVGAFAQSGNSLKGDVNEDGKVDVADILEIVNIIMNGNNGDNGDDNAPAGVEAVDLDLPSGTLWANMNVGASKPEDYGDYFAWGETTQQDRFIWASYKWSQNGEGFQTKYCTDSNMGVNGFTDGKTVLDAEDDAATANWGSGWCMPTKAQFVELVSNTTSEWTTQNGVNGRKFTSNTNGKSIFLPAAGYYSNHGLDDDDSYGLYWSSTLSEYSSNSACHLYFLKWGVKTDYYDHRYYGYSVRPVRKN